jgi:hypothetical protein
MPCGSIDDCSAFAATSYSLGVPEMYQPFGADPSGTNWGSTLSRGVICAPSAADGGGGSYCEFQCGDFMAVGPAGNGEACYCLPGYSLTSDKMACTFGTTHQCSIFSYGTDTQRATLLQQYGIQTQNPMCNACNSDFHGTDILGCHSGEYVCDIRTSALNGDCSEVLSDAQFMQCVAQKTNFSCTSAPSCLESCTDTVSCYACYTCSPTSAPIPMPTCSGDGGSMGDGGNRDAPAAHDSGNPGQPDSGKSDSGNSDSGNSDSGKSDSGNSDSGKSDSGNSDSGKSDSGNSDSGKPDSGKPEAGKPDAGVDAGPQCFVSCGGGRLPACRPAVGPPKVVCCGADQTCACNSSGNDSVCPGAFVCWCNGPTAVTCASQDDCCCSNGTASCTPSGC